MLKLLINFRSAIVTSRPALEKDFVMDFGRNTVTDNEELKDMMVNWWLFRREIKKFGVSVDRLVCERIAGGNALQYCKLVQFLKNWEKDGGLERVGTALAEPMSEKEAIQQSAVNPNAFTPNGGVRNVPLPARNIPPLPLSRS
jgi:hypothetical protein